MDNVNLKKETGTLWLTREQKGNIYVIIERVLNVLHYFLGTAR